MPIQPATLQSAYATTYVARGDMQRVVQGDRSPGWIRVLNAGRAVNLDSDAMRSGAIRLEAQAPHDEAVAKAIDYLRGAAWHAEQGVGMMTNSIKDALAGHDDLSAQATRLLDPKQGITIPNAYTTFETSVKQVDPDLLARVAAASQAAIPAFDRSMSDIDQARQYLRAIAQNVA